MTRRPAIPLEEQGAWVAVPQSSTSVAAAMAADEYAESQAQRES